MESLTDLIARCRGPQRRGRHEAFAELVARFQGAACAWAVDAGCDAADAQDAVQEAFLTAYLRLDDLRAAAAFPGWLRQIVRRKAGVQRGAASQAEAIVTTTATDPRPGALADLESAERRRTLRRALAALPAHEREVAELHYLHGVSLRQVAEHLHLTPAAVNKRAQRARQHLRERLTVMSPELFDSEPTRELLRMLDATDPRAALEVRASADADAMLPTVARIRALGASLHDLDDGALRSRAEALRDRTPATASPDDLDASLPEAFAVAAEALRRAGAPLADTLDDIDAALLEALLLHRGTAVAVADSARHIRVAALPLFLHGLAGPAHLIAADESTAAAACATLAPIADGLGCHVVADRDGAPATGDVVCTTYARLGFEHLCGTRTRLGFGIVVDVETLLIDEASTPLHLSRPVPGWSPDIFVEALPAAAALLAAQRQGDAVLPLYEVQGYSLQLTDAGLARALEHTPSLRDAADPEGLRTVLTQSLRAAETHRRGRDYEVIDGRVVILGADGTPQPTRRFSDGLHQALEVKEGVEIQPEIEVVAAIRVRDLFRRFDRLAGLADAPAPS